MKKTVLLLLILNSVILSAREDLNYKNYFRSDSSHVYVWDIGLNDWILSSSQINYYNGNGKLDSVIIKSLITGLNIGKSVFFYNEEGLVTEQLSYGWNKSWIPTVKNIISYNEYGSTSEILVQVYRTGEWINNRWQKNYTYDYAGRLTEYQMYYWQNNTWSLPTTDYSSYDELGRLVKRVAIYPNGKTDYQITYNYDASGLRSEMYAQYPSGTNWLNWWLFSFQYDNCGMQTSQIQYKGVITDWIPQSKTITFYSFNTDGFPGKKVPVCHNGHTIYVSKNAVQSHLAHGDCIGECIVEKETERRALEEKENAEKPPFTIYPNPAKEKITIRFKDDDNSETKRVELTDFYGKLIKSFDIKGNNDLVINRGNLLSGKYTIRLIGNEIFSTVVIFE